jgi:nucleoid DNA-binding protein
VLVGGGNKETTMSDEAEPKKAGAGPKPVTVARKELALRVQKATGAKLKDIQLIMRATLTAMSDALKAGEHLRLPPFGAARVLRQADPDSGQSMRVALREVKEKAPKAERPARPAAAPKAVRAAPTPKAAKAAKTRARRAAGPKQTLAAKGEAE